MKKNSKQQIPKDKIQILKTGFQRLGICVLGFALSLSLVSCESSTISTSINHAYHAAAGQASAGIEYGTLKSKAAIKDVKEHLAKIQWLIDKIRGAKDRVEDSVNNTEDTAKK